MDRLFLIFVGTILVTRLWLFFYPISSPKISWLKLHHYIYGIVLGALALAFYSSTLFAVSLGLFIDELPLLVRYGNNFYWKEYNSLFSRIGVIVICLFVILSYFFFFNL